MSKPPMTTLSLPRFFQRGTVGSQRVGPAMQRFCGDWPPDENRGETPDLAGTMGSRASTTRTSEVGGRVVLRERHPRTSCRNGQEVELDERCPLRTQFPRAVGISRNADQGCTCAVSTTTSAFGLGPPKAVSRQRCNPSGGARASSRATLSVSRQRRTSTPWSAI